MLDLIKQVARRSGKGVTDLGVLEREYAVTRAAYSNRDSLLLFKARGVHDDILNYTNLITLRKDFRGLFGVASDVEAYEKYSRAFKGNAPIEMRDFNEYFERRDDVDLTALPFLKYFREDGGLYLTSSVYVMCYWDICNSSFHRTMLLNEERATLRIVPRHLHYLMNRYFEEGKDAPVALVLGLDPFHEIASASNPPLGTFELFVGAALGGEARFARTPRYGIPVPINASIVVEGVIKRDEVATEGPFTDILLLVDEPRQQPVFLAEGIYFNRARPLVHHAIVPGLWEHQFLMGFSREPLIYEAVKKVAPGLKSIRLTEGGAGWLHLVISLKQMSPGEDRLAAIAAISAHPSVKHVVVVDDDIDIEDPLMVEWAIATRLRGGDGVIVLRDVKGSTLDPRSSNGVGDKVVVLATKPYSESWEKYRRVGIPDVPNP